MVDADRRRELKKAARQAERDAFLKGMPCGMAEAHDLFDRVDKALQTSPCHGDLRYTLAACEELSLSPATLLPWLREQGGGCDCEVVANVEERVEDSTGVGG